MSSNRGFERKHYFIDRKFQGRYMMTFLVPMLVMLAFMLVTLGSASRVLVNTTTRIIKEDVENMVAAQLQDKTEPQANDYLDIMDGVRAYLRSYGSNTKYRKALIGALLWVFGAGIFVVIIETVLMTIYFSHRVAGPVYRFERACHAIIDGDYTESIHLRKGDEMQNLARLMNQAVETTRGRLITLRDEVDREKKAEACSLLKI